MPNLSSFPMPPRATEQGLRNALEFTSRCKFQVLASFVCNFIPNVECLEKNFNLLFHYQAVNKHVLAIREGLGNKAKSGAEPDKESLMKKMDIKTDSFLCRASYEIT